MLLWVQYVMFALLSVFVLKSFEFPIESFITIQIILRTIRPRHSPPIASKVPKFHIQVNNSYTEQKSHSLDNGWWFFIGKLIRHDTHWLIILSFMHTYWWQNADGLKYIFIFRSNEDLYAADVWVYRAKMENMSIYIFLHVFTNTVKIYLFQINVCSCVLQHLYSMWIKIWYTQLWNEKLNIWPLIAFEALFCSDSLPILPSILNMSHNGQLCLGWLSEWEV